MLNSVIAPSIYPHNGFIGLFKRLMLRLRPGNGKKHNSPNTTVLTHNNDIAQHPPMCDKQTQGKVFLVGAGPGDPELLTLKAHRLLQQADVVLYDWLVSQDILALISDRAEKRFVGKKCGQHSISQSQICQLLVDYARSGKTVVRLKSGDPAVFARSGEELDYLAENGIPVAIVPGITAASGASAATGILLTDRDCAQSVRLVTAHGKDASVEPDWANLAASAASETLVFYMGLKRLELICRGLQRHGLAGSTAVAVVEGASTPGQLECCGTLTDITSKAESMALQGPAVIIVGEVVSRQRHVISDLAKGIAING